jgi:hypothetical protein
VQPTAACWTLKRAGQGCVLASPAFARVAQPSGEAGCRTGALRFGDPRVMALAGALCATLTGVVGFTHRSLRAQVACLLGTPYAASQMSYDLTRLRRKGLIRRLPGTNTYVLTADGSASRCFTSRSTTDSWSRCWPLTARQRHRSCARRLGSSTAPSPTTSVRHAWKLPETLEKSQTSSPQGALRRCRACARHRWPLRGSSRLRAVTVSLPGHDG